MGIRYTGPTKNTKYSKYQEADRLDGKSIKYNSTSRSGGGGTDLGESLLAMTGGTITEETGNDGKTYVVHTGPFPSGINITQILGANAHIFVEMSGGGGMSGSVVGGGSGQGGGGGAGGFGQVKVALQPSQTGPRTFSIGGAGQNSTFSDPYGSNITFTAGGNGAGGTYQGPGGAGGAGGTVQVSGNATVTFQRQQPGTTGHGWGGGDGGGRGGELYPNMPSSYVLSSFPSPITSANYGRGGNSRGGGSGGPGNPGNGGFARVFYPADLKIT